MYRINYFVFISEYYNKNGNTINIKFIKNGKKDIPRIIVGKDSGYFYPIRITKNCNDLEKDHIYDIEYRLVRVVNEIVYNKIIRKKKQEIIQIHLLNLLNLPKKINNLNLCVYYNYLNINDI